MITLVKLIKASRRTAEIQVICLILLLASCRDQPALIATVNASPGPGLTIQATSQGMITDSTPLPTEVITATKTPWPTEDAKACLKQSGKMEIHHLETSLLPETLDFRIYLPACYPEWEASRFPVLYLIHGKGYNDDQWDRLGADEMADRLIAAGEVQPFIIVMPYDRSLYKQPDKDTFGEAVAQVLVPWIDAHYRTLSDRSHRSIGGLSRGAGWALHIGLTRWKLFGSLGLHSMAIFLIDTPSINTWLNGIPDEEMPNIFIDIGDNDRPEIRESATWFENVLIQRDIPHEWHLYSGDHDENYWGGHIEAYLRWYGQAW